MNEKTLGELEAELIVCANKYQEASTALSMARSRETDALNALNRAQKAIDDRLLSMRKISPASSDWRCNERKGVQVEN